MRKHGIADNPYIIIENGLYAVTLHREGDDCVKITLRDKKEQFLPLMFKIDIISYELRVVNRCKSISGNILQLTRGLLYQQYGGGYIIRKIYYERGRLCRITIQKEG